jgi:SAM-dependent methyltransferase
MARGIGNGHGSQREPGSAVPAGPTVAGDFTGQARWYADARPGYPDALVTALMAQAGARAGDVVVDVGAGTGISSRELARHGLAVVAVEPNGAMRAAAGPSPGVAWRDGSFEATGLPAASADWVVAAQALHWADLPRALPEMRRILKPGRWFTAFWNDRDTEASELLVETLALIRSIVPGYEERYRGRDWAAELVAGGHFGEVAPLTLRHAVPMTAGRFLNLWRSHNRLNATAGPERFPRILAALEALLARRGVREFPVPYVCRAWSARAR